MIHTGHSLRTIFMLSPAPASTLSTGNRLGAHVPCASMIVRVVRGLCGTEGVRGWRGPAPGVFAKGITGAAGQGRGAVAEGQPWS